MGSEGIKYCAVKEQRAAKWRSWNLGLARGYPTVQATQLILPWTIKIQLPEYADAGYGERRFMEQPFDIPVEYNLCPVQGLSLILSAGVAENEAHSIGSEEYLRERALSMSQLLFPAVGVPIQTIGNLGRSNLCP